MNLPILKHMQKVPGGLMIVPMLITAIINSIWPEALQIGGSTTGAFSTGTMTIIGIVLILLSVWVNSMHTHEKAPAREKAPAK